MLHFCLNVTIEGHLSCLSVPFLGTSALCIGPSATQVPLWSAQVSFGHLKSMPK